MSARYQPDREGIGQIMRSPEMELIVREIAEEGMAHAVGISPERTGEYKAGFRLTSTRRGGPKDDRAEAQVVNGALDRVLSDVVDGHDVFRQALAHIEGVAGG